ncbi:MAG TPA: ABC transporter ATP-binding protein [Jatrophihabitans sp.]
MSAADDGGRAVRVEGLRIEVAASGHDIVTDVSFEIGRGQVLALVGESGSGKTTAALALLAHERRGVRIAGGRVTVGGVDMFALDKRGRRDARGKLVSYVPQDPGTALNPARRIGAHLIEALEVHDWGGSDQRRRERVAEMMREVSLPDDPEFLRRYPHQLSGGQQQRVCIAMAFACQPAVVVLDEPTTGLDVTTQAHVLATIRRITSAEGAAALYVSHDLSVVSSLADRVAVMYAGRLVEQGSAETIFTAAAHPYTRQLIAAVPRIEVARSLAAIPGRAPSPGSRPPGCPFEPRCAIRIAECRERLPEAAVVGPGHTARCLRIAESKATLATTTPAPIVAGADHAEGIVRVGGLRAYYGDSEVVHDVTFAVARRECLALVGESGSGKTTVSRCVAGLHDGWDGTVTLHDAELPRSARHRTRAMKRDIQYIFQNPYGSLNPRRTVGQSVARPLALLGEDRRTVRKQVAGILERVSLPPQYAAKYPDELSGGERQRVAIARALVCRPKVLLCDEVTSALDVSVQAAIVTLLRELQEDLGLSILFVTHNLPLVRSIAQRVAVMQDGRIVEAGSVDQVLERPEHDYTRRLLADAPRLSDADPAPDPRAVS